MRTVADILDVKGREVASVHPDATVFEALQLMAEKDIGAVLVVNEGRLVGIFSERDYARKVILHGRSSKTTTVQELMTQHVYSISPTDRVEDCMTLMTTTRARHLPVFEDDSLVGIISIGDVVNQIIAEHRFTIKELEKYIRGAY